MEESDSTDLGHALIINENLDYKESELRQIFYPIASVSKIGIEKKAQLESKNSELKTISDHKKQVSKKAIP